MAQEVLLHRPQNTGPQFGQAAVTRPHGVRSGAAGGGVRLGGRSALS